MGFHVATFLLLRAGGGKWFKEMKIEEKNIIDRQLLPYFGQWRVQELLAAEVNKVFYIYKFVISNLSQWNTLLELFLVHGTDNQVHDNEKIIHIDIPAQSNVVLDALEDFALIRHGEHIPRLLAYYNSNSLMVVAGGLELFFETNKDQEIPGEYLDFIEDDSFRLLYKRNELISSPTRRPIYTAPPNRRMVVDNIFYAKMGGRTDNISVEFDIVPFNEHLNSSPERFIHHFNLENRYGSITDLNGLMINPGDRLTVRNPNYDLFPDYEALTMSITGRVAYDKT